MATDAELLIDYGRALAAHERIQRNLQAAEDAVAAARRALSAQLVPEGAKMGERFGVYVGNDLVQIELTSSEPRIIIRLNVKPPPATTPP